MRRPPQIDAGRRHFAEAHGRERPFRVPFSRYFVFDPAHPSISMAPVHTSEISDVDTGLVVDDFRVGYTFAVLADEDRLCVSGMTVRLPSLSVRAT